MPIDVLLIQPSWTGGTEETMCIPLGLAWCASVLEKNGLVVAVFDFLLEHKKNWQKSLYDFIQRENVIIVGVQFHSVVSFRASLKTAEFLKTNWPDMIVLAGGDGIGNRKDILLSSGFVDFVVKGEGEMTLVEICHAILNSGKDSLSTIPGGYVYSNNGEIVFTGDRPLIKNLDELPFPSRHLFRLDKYPQWSVFTSRGCPYGCTFCSASAWWKHQLRFRSIENVMDEMEFLKNNYDVKHVYIGDDIFSYNRKHAIDFCHQLLTRELSFNWSCLTRADCIDRELLKLMKESGCSEISYGVESANDTTLKLVNKREGSEDIRKAIVETKEIGINVRATVILGLPNEDENDVLKTLDFLIDVQPNEIQLYSLAAYDGAILFGNLEKYGIKIIDDNPETWSRNVLDPGCETELLTSDDIKRLAMRYVTTLAKYGYVYHKSTDKGIKQNLEKVIYTGFCPVQKIPDIRKC